MVEGRDFENKLKKLSNLGVLSALENGNESDNIFKHRKYEYGKNKEETYAFLFSIVNLINALVPWQSDDFLIMIRLMIHFVSALIVLFS